MQERQVTIGDNTYTLEEPFLVLATQNPLEQEGTYPLPEAQVDRFMLKIVIGYPEREEERLIIRQNMADAPLQVNAVITPQDILQARHIVRDIYMDERIEQYIIDIVFATRQPADYKLGKLKNLLQYGSSPRGSISLAVAAKSMAFMEHRGFVVPDDIKNICHDVLRHRIGLTYEAEAENVTTDDIIRDIIRTIEVP
jgi:MoxR-like ATPase